ncbi:MAG: fluoride efflux transporter CrcB [Chloroflexi bacterium]|nr:fluoride efflux transporter CrcB [Chloroflexota bacterium]MYF80098.1 fluoride efflux transporter CrcB [Chloroflexota bacterium]MYK61455.1 fluoride efflux transporter CrcB [Chloroflexota bacterium]
MEKLLSVAIGGAAGALARYGTVVAYQRFAPSTFPLAILTVNVLGSLLFGLIWAYAEDRDWISENMRLLVLTGFLGSFTTFSTFAFDEAMFIRSGSWSIFVANLLISNAAALAAVFVGFRVGKLI